MAGDPPPTNGQTAMTGNLIEWLAPPPTEGGGDEPALSIARTGNTISITYEGSLESTTDLGTPFTAVNGATSPYTVDTSTAASRYYRASR
jgi:hypothetical protein